VAFPPLWRLFLLFGGLSLHKQLYRLPFHHVVAGLHLLLLLTARIYFFRVFKSGFFKTRSVNIEEFHHLTPAPPSAPSSVGRSALWIYFSVFFNFLVFCLSSWVLDQGLVCLLPFRVEECRSGVGELLSRPVKGKVHIPPSNYHPIDNVPPKLSIVTMSPPNYQTNDNVPPNGNKKTKITLQIFQ
jgi:hypothetical protein